MIADMRPPIPKEHGAWAMLLIPWWVGAAIVDFNPSLLLAALGVGALLMYLGVSAGLMYLRPPPSRREQAHLTWLVIYGGCGTVLLLPVVLQTPRLLLLAPLVVLGLLSEYLHLRYRRERALLNGAASIFALSMLLPACILVAQHDWQRPSSVWAWLSVLAFFLGSLLFVKSNFRGRRDRSLRASCVVYHVVVPVAVYATAPHFGFALTLVPSLLRVALLLWPRPPPIVVGIVEISTTAAFLAIILSIV